MNNPFLNNCDGSVLYYHASQTTGDDTIVRLCRHHAEAVGYGVDHYAGSAEPNALCDESPLLKRTLRRFDTVTIDVYEVAGYEFISNGDLRIVLKGGAEFRVRKYAGDAHRTLDQLLAVDK
jgi:hypothetical protein